MNECVIYWYMFSFLVIDLENSLHLPKIANSDVPPNLTNTKIKKSNLPKSSDLSADQLIRNVKESIQG